MICSICCTFTNFVNIINCQINIFSKVRTVNNFVKEVIDKQKIGVRLVIGKIYYL